MAIATVRVCSQTTDPNARPAREHLEAAASLLRRQGFAVLRIGRFGVNIEGDAQVFERELGVRLSVASTGQVAPARPRAPELSGLIDTVEIAGDPIPFKRP